MTVRATKDITGTRCGPCLSSSKGRTEHAIGAQMKRVTVGATTIWVRTATLGCRRPKVIKREGPYGRSLDVGDALRTRIIR